MIIAITGPMVSKIPNNLNHGIPPAYLDITIRDCIINFMKYLLIFLKICLPFRIALFYIIL